MTRAGLLLLTLLAVSPGGFVSSGDFTFSRHSGQVSGQLAQSGGTTGGNFGNLCDSTAIACMHFDESGSTDLALDSRGNGYDLTPVTTFASVPGKVDGGRESADSSNIFTKTITAADPLSQSVSGDFTFETVLFPVNFGGSGTYEAIGDGITWGLTLGHDFASNFHFFLRDSTAVNHSYDTGSAGGAWVMLAIRVVHNGGNCDIDTFSAGVLKRSFPGEQCPGVATTPGVFRFGGGNDDQIYDSSTMFVGGRTDAQLAADAASCNF